MTTLNLQVAASAGDGLESGGTPALGASNMRLDATNKIGATRFSGVTVPQGSTIHTADYQLYVYSTTYDDTDLAVHCEDTDDSAALSEDADNFSNRTPTTANTTDNQSAIGTGWHSIDISSAVQAVVNRGGWTSGNHLTVLIFVNSSASTIRARTYDNDPALAAKLDLDFTAPSASSLPAIMYQRRQQGMS